MSHVMRNSKIWRRPPPLKMVATSICIPKYDPAHPRGDDAHFVTANEQCIGVADGDSSSREKGIDSGKYARQLMKNSVLSLTHNNKIVKKSPKQVLEEAYSKTTAQGSSTACIVSFSGEECVLRAANVGNSGFLVIRNGAVLYESSREQHSMLGTKNDDPSMAKEIEERVEKGDLVVLGTDGVFDNMPRTEILDILAMVGNDLEELCSYIAKIALFNSLEKKTDTPEGQDGENHEGGKIDDITLVIARIE